jgi:hypothetical protein
MLFKYPDDDAGRITNWYNGEVISIVNEKKNTVRIKWGPLCLGEDDEPETVEQRLSKMESKYHQNWCITSIFVSYNVSE